MAAGLLFPWRRAARNMARAQRGGAEPGAFIARRVPPELPRRRAVGTGPGAVGGSGGGGGRRGAGRPCPAHSPGSGAAPAGSPGRWGAVVAASAAGRGRWRSAEAVRGRVAGPGPAVAGRWPSPAAVCVPRTALCLYCAALGGGWVRTCGGAVCLGLTFERMKTAN